MDNLRNLEYEKKFRAYLFKGNWERHLKICENINVVESTDETRNRVVVKTTKEN